MLRWMCLWYSELCKMIIELGECVELSAIKGERSKFVVFDVNRLANSLVSLEAENKCQKNENKKLY